ncbi:MAG: hypothetical protein Crog4KO_04340 [Crocinitomicaceae bacterium]
MAFPVKKQNFQDWITQQWVILLGRKINAKTHSWLIGPFGEVNGIGKKFIEQLAIKEKLSIDDSHEVRGLIGAINQLNLKDDELQRLSKQVVEFYEKTSCYDLQLSVKWNPFFKVFGLLLRLIFSRRIKQLNIPIRRKESSDKLTSEVILLKDTSTNQVKRTIWFRSFQTTSEVVYSGVYETCDTPSGKTCIKAVFPLPNGNATVILTPSVGKNGELILESSGRQIGDSGFYFLLKDSKGQLWTKFIRSFKDKLVVQEISGQISAIQTLSMWNIRVLTFEYEIKLHHNLN